MKRFSLLSILVAGVLTVQAQDKVFSRTGSVTFSSETPIETIEAKHSKVACAVNLETGDVQVSILVKGFAFEKALMEEHFNENYMESGSFPRATFKGKIDDLDAAKFKGDDSFTAQVTGDLTIHGVTVKRTFDIEFKKIEGSIVARADFVVKPKDHDIKIPGVVAENIAAEIKVELIARLEKMK